MDDRLVDVKLPAFKGLKEKLALPLSILNCSRHYVCVPTEKQKKALLDIHNLVISAFMENIANNLPAEVIKGTKKMGNARVLAEKIRSNARPEDKEFMEQFVNTCMLV